MLMPIVESHPTATQLTLPACFLLRPLFSCLKTKALSQPFSYSMDPFNTTTPLTIRFLWPVSDHLKLVSAVFAIYHLIRQAQVVQKADNTIHWINHYPVDSVVCFVSTYLLDSKLSMPVSMDSIMQSSNIWGQ